MSFQSLKPIVMAVFVVLCGFVLLHEGEQEAAAGPFRGQFMPLQFQGDGDCPNCPDGKCPLIPQVAPNAIKKATKPIADTVSPKCKDCKCDNCDCINGECNQKHTKQYAPVWKSVVTGRGHCCQPSHCQSNRQSNCQPRFFLFGRRCR